MAGVISIFWPEKCIFISFVLCGRSLNGKRSVSGKIAAQARVIRLAAFDVDGVLTDGRIYLNGEGHEFEAYYIHDGLGIRRLMEAGVEVAFLSARRSPTIRHRAQALGVHHVHIGVRDKWVVFEGLMHELGLPPERTAYMGDDQVDLPVLSKCGLACAPANACPEVRRCADWIAEKNGGDGAVREMCELILWEQGLW